MIEGGATRRLRRSSALEGFRRHYCAAAPRVVAPCMGQSKSIDPQFNIVISRQNEAAEKHLWGTLRLV